MTGKDVKLPVAISDYIRDHFREDFLFEVKGVLKRKRSTYYTVEVTKDNYIHKLLFNEKGTLVADDADEAFPEDTHDAPGFGDVPE